jgi:hypothetical protein
MTKYSSINCGEEPILKGYALHEMTNLTSHVGAKIIIFTSNGVTLNGLIIMSRGINAA